jgi:hypothetical protein
VSLVAPGSAGPAGALHGTRAFRFPPLLLDPEAVRDTITCWRFRISSTYYNLAGEKRNYSRPVDLRRFDLLGWMTAKDDVWEIRPSNRSHRIGLQLSHKQTGPLTKSPVLPEPVPARGSFHRPRGLRPGILKIRC